MNRFGSLQLFSLLALLSMAACRKSQAEDAAFAQYVDQSVKELQQRQAELTRDFKLGQWERFDWYQERQELVFSQQGVPKVIAKVQIVGSYSKLSKTWRWAWANDTVLPALKQDVQQVKQLGATKGWSQLTQPQWSSTEDDGWYMTAVTLRVTNAKGAYRSPDKNSVVFMVIKDIHWAPGQGSGGA